MNLEKEAHRSKGRSTLEKWLIFLFVAMTCVSIALVVVYFTDKNDTSSLVEGECVLEKHSICYSNTNICLRSNVL